MKKQNIDILRNAIQGDNTGFIERSKIYEILAIKADILFKTDYEIDCFIDNIKHINTADVVEVKHGEWVVDAYNGDEMVRIPYVIHEHNEPYCSLCGFNALLDSKKDYVPSKFCPCCGAKMDEERIEK